MATPANSTYSGASGVAIYGGRAAPAALPAWVSALPLWQWYGIPNTAMSSVQEVPSQHPEGHADGKVTAWCGATLRRLGSVYMLGAAGGHSDLLTNDTIALQLNVATPAWVQRRASTLKTNMYQKTAVYADGRRSALHTYYSTQYDNTNDRMLIVSAGVPFDASGVQNGYPVDYPYPTGTPLMMAFDYATNDWLPPDTLARYPWGNTGTADLCCADPLTGDVYKTKESLGQLWRYRPSTNAWTNIGNHGVIGSYAGSAVDPIRNRMLVVGDFSGASPANMVNLTNAATTSAGFSGLGGAALAMSSYPGVIYDEANDCFLVAKNDAPNISFYRVNAATLFVDVPPIVGTVAQRTSGIHNSIQYVPELRGVVIANSYTGNVQFMRTAL